MTLDYVDRNLDTINSAHLDETTFIMYRTKEGFSISVVDPDGGEVGREDFPDEDAALQRFGTMVAKAALYMRPRDEPLPVDSIPVG